MVSQGPTLIYDKSALQGLSEKEAYWLHRYFHCVLTPTIYVEILADLNKNPRPSKTAEEEVATLARKIPSYAFTPSMFYRDLLIEDFMAGPVDMGRRPYVGRGKRVRHPDGSNGMFFEEAPEAKAFRFWSEARFEEMERLEAQEWRTLLNQLDLSERRKSLSWAMPFLKKLKNEKEVLDYVDKALGLDTYRMLCMALPYLGIPRELHTEATNLWIRRGGKPLIEHVPYVAHVLRVEMFFTFLLIRRLIADERASHHVDFNYFKYLPFCVIFCSNDKLHKKLAPMLMQKDQVFLDLNEIKMALRELVEYYESYPEEKSKYRNFPPYDRRLQICDIYDRACNYDWRSFASAPEEPRDPERDKEIINKVMLWQKLYEEQYPDSET